MCLIRARLCERACYGTNVCNGGKVADLTGAMRTHLFITALLAVVAMSKAVQVNSPVEATTVFACPADFIDITQRSEIKFPADIAGVSGVRLLVETRECKCARVASCKFCTHMGKKGIIFESLFRARTVDASDWTKGKARAPSPLDMRFLRLGCLHPFMPARLLLLCHPLCRQ